MEGLRSKSAIAGAMLAALLLSGCSGGTALHAIPATATRDALGVSRAVAVAPAAMTFAGTGAANAQTFTATSLKAARFSATSSDPGCATVAANGGTARTTSEAFTVTPIGAGSCTITVSDDAHGPGAGSDVALVKVSVNGAIALGSPSVTLTCSQSSRTCTPSSNELVTIFDSASAGPYTIAACSVSSASATFSAPACTRVDASDATCYANGSSFGPTIAISQNDVVVRGYADLTQTGSIACTVTIADPKGNSAGLLVTYSNSP